MVLLAGAGTKEQRRCQQPQGRPPAARIRHLLLHPQPDAQGAWGGSRCSRAATHGAVHAIRKSSINLLHSVSHIRHVSPRTRHDARVRDCADLPPSQLHLRPLRPPAIQVSRLKRRTGYGFAGLDLTAVSPSLGGPQASSNQVGAGLILMDGQPSRCGLAAAAAATSRAPHVAPRCMDFFPQLLIIKF